MERRRSYEESFVYLQVSADEVVRFPESWTSLGEQDPFVVVASGRSALHVRELQQLVELVVELQER